MVAPRPRECSKVLEGCQEVDAGRSTWRCSAGRRPELVEQYIRAFEKVWPSAKLAQGVRAGSEVAGGRGQVAGGRGQGAGGRGRGEDCRLRWWGLLRSTRREVCVFDSGVQKGLLVERHAMTQRRQSGRFFRLAIAATALSVACATQSLAAEAEKLMAKIYNSGFALAHDTYNGLSSASDGKIYYVLSAEEFDVGAEMYVFDPPDAADPPLRRPDRGLRREGHQGRVPGEEPRELRRVRRKALLRHAHRLLLASSTTWRSRAFLRPGTSRTRAATSSSYDMATGQFEDLGIAPHGEGIITMNMDTRRGRLYGITWPKGYFCYYDLAAKTMKNLGLYAEQGESGKGPTTARCAARWPSTRPTARSISASARARSSAIATTRIRSRRSWAKTCGRTTSGSTTRPVRATWATTGGKSSGSPRKT